ncbi:MAG: hypothetical protein GDA55_06635 [Cellvibrionales bacterium]|nr:hypothetical protein [Cellvibrionales bacterium]
MLYDRIINYGTINEPKGKSNPDFARQATVNWMRALRILIEDKDINFATTTAFYVKANRRKKMNLLVENTVLEQLFLALHHLSALGKFCRGSPVADYARVGVLAWYYGVANAASAMTVAQSDSFKEDHAGTAQTWDEQIASRGLTMAPFSWRVSSLLERAYRAEIAALRRGGNGIIQMRPITKDDALGVAAGYLSGSAKWYAWKTEENLKRDRKFKDLGVDNFRSKRARALRDEWLERKSIGFVHQASRYLGKANYREALFLAYRPGTETALSGYVDDMHTVLRAFIAMAGAFARRKLGKDLWAEFVADVDAKKAFTAMARDIWDECQGKK